MSTVKTTLAHGRDHLAIPGPSVMPERVLNAMHRPAPNIYTGDLVDITASVKSDLNKLAGNSGEVGIYIGNGHAAWEASLVNFFSRGDKVLFLVNGRFGNAWAQAAQGLQIDVDVMDFGTEQTVDATKVQAKLVADKQHAYKAVLMVHTDTASSASNDIRGIRAAIDAAGHPALYFIDSIASFACESFHMDSMGVDVMITASQKGLMTPPGLAMVFVSEKVWDYQKQADLVTPYWNLHSRVYPRMFPDNFNGTPPTHHLYGLREALNMLLEEGIDNSWRRHEVQANAVWAAVNAWGQGGGITFNIKDEAMRSKAVTMITTPKDIGGKLQQYCKEHFGVVIGVALVGTASGTTTNDAFRIGHMGHLNPSMLLGTLGTVEAALEALGVERGKGAVEAATRVFAQATK